MGAEDDDPKAKPDTRPLHQVHLDAFWIDRTESTNANFANCVVARVCDPRPARPGTTGVASKSHMNYFYDQLFANYPVLIYEPVDAETYCQCVGRRLPTEAEFERAARGTDGRMYPWGDQLDCEHASYLGCTNDTTDVETPQSGASPYGALNMAGNVWEWVSDWYSEDYYASSSSTNPTGPLTGEYKVRRGGGYSSLPRDMRVTSRASGRAQHYFDGQMGFRCALSDDPS
jgi:formylglycine-generating enzyme required for sulfatase activity